MARTTRTAICSSLVLMTTTFIWLSGCAAKARPVSAPPSLSVANIQSANTAQLEQNGLVYFYRLPNFAGSFVSFPVWDEAEKDKDIVVMRNGGYYLHFCSPGKHTFTTKSEATDSLSIDVESGKVCFVRYSIRMGAFVGRPHIELVSLEQGSQEAVKCEKLLKREASL